MMLNSVEANGFPSEKVIRIAEVFLSQEGVLFE